MAADVQQPQSEATIFLPWVILALLTLSSWVTSWFGKPDTSASPKTAPNYPANTPHSSDETKARTAGRHGTEVYHSLLSPATHVDGGSIRRAKSGMFNNIMGYRDPL